MKCKRLFCWGMAIALVCSGISPQMTLQAQELMETEVNTFEGYSYQELYDGTLEITGYAGSDTELAIPGQIDGKRVTTIGDQAFMDCSSVTGITIPEGVTSIGEWAFYGCKSLTSLIIPEGVTSIQDQAFYGCKSLTSLAIPDSVTKMGDTLYAFSGCREDLTLLVGYGSYAEAYALEWAGFGLTYHHRGVEPSEDVYQCRGLEDSTLEIVGYTGNDTELVLPGQLGGKKVTSVAGFYDCSSLESVVIPEGVTDIAGFSGCSSLKNITIPEGVERIGAYAFSECSSLENMVIPEGVTSVGAYAFYNCSALTSIALPERMESIGEAAFEFCSNLTRITLPEGITSIGEAAFYSCSALTAVNIPEGVVSIGNSAFGGCSSLPDITIPEGVESIGESAFASCSSLSDITIPEGVASIGDNAFLNCNSLKKVVIPKGVASIGNSAFNGCAALTNITLPEGLTSIGESAFCFCQSLENVVIPEGVESIGERTFYGCYDLTSATIPASVTSIGESAFYNCISLKDIEIPESVINIGNQAFDNCGIDLTFLVFPGSYAEAYVVEQGYEYRYIASNLAYKVRELEDGTLEITSYKGNDTELIIPNQIRGKRVTSIGARAFSQCTSLEKVTIPTGITSIGEAAFSDCSALTEVTMPESLTNINTFAFLNCSDDFTLIVEGYGSYAETYAISYGMNYRHMGEEETDDIYKCLMLEDGTLEIVGYIGNSTELIIPGELGGKALTSIHEKAFYECSSLEKVTIPGSVTSIGDDAFYGCNALTEVSIPEGVTSIGSRAFFECSSLVSVKIPESVMSMGSWVFAYCNDALTLIIKGYGSCAENYAIQYSINYYRMDEEVSDGTYKCRRLEDGTLEIAGYIGNSTELTLPEELGGKKVTSIGSGAFSGCSSLTELTIPEGVTSIGDSAFYGCSSLKSVAIPAGVTSIGDGMFSGCNSLTEVTIPEGVTSIGAWVFENCSKLLSITIPESVTHIERYTFYGCDMILVVTPGSYAETCATDWNLEYCYVGDDLSDIAYKVMEREDGTWEIIGYRGTDTELIIPSQIRGKSVTGIGSAFHDCSDIISITIPEGVTIIGSGAFYGCSSLTEITIPESVTNISNYAFENCNDNVTLIVTPGSYAETYAKKNNLKSSYETPDTSHNYTSEVIKKATCTVDGIMKFTCTECGSSYSQKIPATGHQEVTDEAVSATCTEDGKTQGSHCSVCNTVIKAQETVPAGHKKVTDKAVAATCTEDGKTQGSHCSVCNTVIEKQEVIPATGHKEVTDEAIAATCTEDGKTQGSHCSVCNTVIEKQEEIPAAGHSYVSQVTNATPTKDGSITETCSVCGDKKDSTTIYAAKTISLSRTAYTYNKKVQKPSVTVKDSKGKALKANTDYTVSYPKGMKDAGIYTVTISFNGNYRGTVKKTFTIAPKGTSISKVTARKKGFTLKWKKQTGQTTGYEIAYSTKKNFAGKTTKTVTVGKNKTTSKSVNKLAAKKKYFVRIRTYKTVKTGGKSTKIYSAWSKAKTVTTKK